MLSLSKIPALDIIESLPKAYFLCNMDSIFVYVNKVGCEKIGYTKDEIYSMSVMDLDPITISLDEWRAFVASSIQQNDVTNLKTLHKTKNGTILPVSVEIQAIQIDGEQYISGLVEYLDALEDVGQNDFLSLLETGPVTSSNEIRRLREQKQRMDLMMNTAPIAISIIDKNMTYKAANKYLLDHVGMSEEQFVGSKVGVLGGSTEFVDFVCELFANEQGVHQKDLELSPASNRRWFHLVGSMLPTKTEAVVVGIDITAEKKKDELLILQSKQAAMGEMIGHIAHQWRHPIASIGQIVENISLSFEAGKLTEKYLEEKVSKINAQIKYMSNTIDDFRNFFSPSKQKKEFCICDSVEKSLTLLQAMLIDKNIKTKVELCGRENCFTYGQPNEFAQVIINIIQNAKDALMQNFIIDPLIIIRVCTVDEKIIITIEDNAGGVNEDIMSKIFYPYFSTKDASIGTGIGLYMSKIIIEKNMNGIIKVENTGAGACFSIILNVVEGPELL